MNDSASALLTDLYQLNMLQSYLDHGETGTAVFELFVRKLPDRRSFLVAAGLEQALAFLEGLHFSVEEIDWLRRTGRFGTGLLDYLSELRFTGVARFHLQTMNSVLEDATGLLFSMRAYFESLDHRVSRTEYQTFSHSLRQRVVGLRDTDWAPRVTAENPKRLLE